MPDPPAPPTPPAATPPAGAPDRTRSGAVWVTALGAFMIFAAAGVLVAVRWPEMTDGMKLALLGALTGACLLAGRLRDRLPATAGVLFHLGAFLLPLNVAAVAVHLDTAWPALLLVEGIAATVAWAVLGRRERSAVLTGAAAGAAVVAAAGISATVASATGWSVPTSAVVALAAAGAELSASRRAGTLASPARSGALSPSGSPGEPSPAHRSGDASAARSPGGRSASRRPGASPAPCPAGGLGGRRRVALAWALVAGAAPVLALVERVVPLGTDVAHLLGLIGRGPSLAAAVSGGLAAGVIGRMAHRRRDLALVVLAAAVLVVGTFSAWVELAPGRGGDLVGLAAVFLLVEVVAAALAGDRFWGAPARVTAAAAEIAAALAGTLALADAGLSFATTPYRTVWTPLAAGVLAAAAWLVADLRRRPNGPDGRWSPLRWSLLVGAGWAPATLGAAGAVLAGTLAGTGSPEVVAVVAVAVAAAAVVSGRSGGHAVAVGLVVGAPLARPLTPVALAAGVSGALVLAGAAVVRAWLAAPPPPARDMAPGAATRPAAEANRVAAWLLALTSLLVLVETALVLMVRLRASAAGPLAVLAGLAVAATAVAAILDRAPAPRSGIRLAAVGRAGAALTVLAGAALPPARLAVLAALVGALAVADSVRSHRPGPLWALPAALPVLVVAATTAVARAAGQTGAHWSTAGTALAVLAAVAAGASLLVDAHLPAGDRTDRGTPGNGSHQPAAADRTDQPAAGHRIEQPATTHRTDRGTPGDRTGRPLAGQRAAGERPARGAGWSEPLLATAAVAALGAAALTAPSPPAFATVVFVVGGIGIMLGGAHRRPELVGAGALLATVGVWLHLSAARIDALDAYAVPVAAILVVAGARASRPPGHRVSSWVAYAPAVALAGGSALVERVASGHGAHALLAGAVGMVAVVAGASRRLAGPLITGTLLLVALTVHESLGVTRQVPTWAWLAAGGATLVAAGLGMERRDTGPVETGRRLVDVVLERFG
jgi:hypothetical protein